ncbi:MAG: hypothetical protein K0Q60_4116 [Microvirga sp.]|nr:hypothetical protein [Microvirga sp.]
MRLLATADRYFSFTLATSRLDHKVATAPGASLSSRRPGLVHVRDEAVDLGSVLEQAHGVCQSRPATRVLQALQFRHRLVCGSGKDLKRHGDRNGSVVLLAQLHKLSMEQARTPT